MYEKIHNEKNKKIKEVYAVIMNTSENELAW